MKRLIIESWLLLLYIEFLLCVKDFGAVCDGVRRQAVYHKCKSVRRSSTELRHAIDLACVFYFKRVRCMQRSAATTILLRRHGLASEMVIGVQILPFASHAWVEIEGDVNDDSANMMTTHQILDRC